MAIATTAITQTSIFLPSFNKLDTALVKAIVLFVRGVLKDATGI